MEIFLYVVSGVLILCGFLGCIVPMLPGVPMAFVGIVLLHLTDAVQFSNTELAVFLALTILTQVANYFLPVWLTKKFGGSKLGTYGSLVGLIVGFFFGPLGMIVGPMIGAFVGELLNSNELNVAVKASLGSFIGFICNMGLGLIVSGIFLWEYLKEMMEGVWRIN